jgi:hypothetical protein
MEIVNETKEIKREIKSPIKAFQNRGDKEMELETSKPEDVVRGEEVNL